MVSTKKVKDLWTDTHGIMVLFIWVLELFLSYSSLRYFQIGLSLKLLLDSLIGSNCNKYLGECTLQNVTQYFCKVKLLVVKYNGGKNY